VADPNETPPLSRDREAHLFKHPEDATPDDVRAAMMSLISMREACSEQAKLQGGMAIVVMVYRESRGLRLGLTAPAMDKEEAAEFVSFALKLFEAGQMFDDEGGAS